MTKVLIALCLAAATAAAQEAKVTPLMTQELAGIDGKEGTMVMVEYAPGGSDAEHRHHAYAFVYVLEGAVVMQVKGGQEEALRFISKLKLITRATSLGGVESLIEHRASVEGPNSSTPKNLLRVSIGLEHAEDLIADLATALR